jgi:hypothetical protein
LGRLTGQGVTTANNVICIGALVDGANVSGSCYIGNIHGGSVDPGTGLAVFAENTGKLGTVLSSRRFKRDIKPMDKSSETLLALKPVTFCYQNDAEATPQFGLVAEDVAEVNPGLVVRDKNGELLSVRYDQVNAMLLNEFLKEHQKVQDQQKDIDSLKEELKEQRNLVQKINAKVQRMAPMGVVTRNP